MYSINPAIVMINMSIKLKLVVSTPPKIMIGRVKTKPILKMLVPMMLPMMISNSFFLTEVMAIISSGIEVPITRMIIVITFSLTFSSLAIFTQLETASSLPTAIKPRPIRPIIIDFKRGHLGSSTILSLSCFLLKLIIYIRK